MAKLTIVVPQVPQSSQAWEIHPADVRNLRTERVTGGLKVTLPEFSLTSAIFFATDSKMVARRFQEQVHARRQLASQWSYDMAFYEMATVGKIHDQLMARGQSLPEAPHLLEEAKSRMLTARQMWENRNFGEAYRESQRAMRPIRILMRMEWDKAVKPLDTPVASPYAVSYFTLPRHYEFMDLKDRLVAERRTCCRAATSKVIPRTPAGQLADFEESISDEVDVLATQRQRGTDWRRTQGCQGRASETAALRGKQCVMLQIAARGKGPCPGLLLEKSRTSLIRSDDSICSLARIVQSQPVGACRHAIQASPDGALFFDSAGGEELAVRFTDTMRWKRFTLCTAG